MSKKMLTLLRRLYDAANVASQGSADDAKVCPKCHNAVYKIEGCDYVSCSCSYEFCYICSAAFIKEDNSPVLIARHHPSCSHRSSDLRGFTIYGISIADLYRTGKSLKFSFVRLQGAVPGSVHISFARSKPKVWFEAERGFQTRSAGLIGNLDLHEAVDGPVREMEKLVDWERHARSIVYRVRWLGCLPSDDDWIPDVQIKNTWAWSEYNIGINSPQTVNSSTREAVSPRREPARAAKRVRVA